MAANINIIEAALDWDTTIQHWGSENYLGTNSLSSLLQVVGVMSVAPVCVKRDILVSTVHAMLKAKIPI